jgi:hypothetical protein
MGTDWAYWNTPKAFLKGMAASFNDVARPIIRPLSLQDL